MRVEPAGEFDNNDDDNHNSPTRHGASIANDGAARHVRIRYQRSEAKLFARTDQLFFGEELLKA